MEFRLLTCPGCKFTVEVYNTEEQIICPCCRLWRMVDQPKTIEQKGE